MELRLVLQLKTEEQQRLIQQIPGLIQGRRLSQCIRIHQGIKVSYSCVALAWNRDKIFATGCIYWLFSYCVSAGSIMKNVSGLKNSTDDTVLGTNVIEHGKLTASYLNHMCANWCIFVSKVSCVVCFVIILHQKEQTPVRKRKLKPVMQRRQKYHLFMVVISAIRLRWRLRNRQNQVWTTNFQYTNIHRNCFSTYLHCSKHIVLPNL